MLFGRYLSFAGRQDPNPEGGLMRKLEREDGIYGPGQRCMYSTNGDRHLLVLYSTVQVGRVPSVGTLPYVRYVQ